MPMAACGLGTANREVIKLPPLEFDTPLNAVSGTPIALANMIWVPEVELRCWIAVSSMNGVWLPLAPQPQMAAACSMDIAVVVTFASGTMISIACTGPCHSPMVAGMVVGNPAAASAAPHESYATSDTPMSGLVLEASVQELVVTLPVAPPSTLATV